MNAAPNTAKAVFLEGVERYAPDQWPAFLDRVCSGQPELRGRVESLLDAHREVGTLQHRELAEGAESDPVANVLPPVTEVPGTVIGPYKLLEQIGEGGFGVVFMAEQTQPVRRKVALKVLKAGMDTCQVVARFEAERQALAIMDHPNIAKVFDGGATDGSRHTPCAAAGDGTRSVPATMGRPYFVMELVKGVPIMEYCDRNHLTPRQRLELFIPVCQAVQHAHQKGIVHRDLKPSNILVTVHDTTPVPKIIDFGIAKAMGQELTDKTLFTGFAQMIGTPLYMSPEQAGQSGLDIDTRSDIYSLGVLLYELLTGTTPFDKARFQSVAYEEIRRIIREEDPPKPSTRLSASQDTLPSISEQRHTEPAKLTKLVCGELDWIVMKALEKDRNRRYETASGLAMDLQRYLSNEPVLACPPSMGYRLRKYVSRNKRPLTTVTGIVLVLLVAVGAVAGTIGWAVRDRDARVTALEREADLASRDAERLLEQGNYPEALSAAKRARGLLPVGCREDLRTRAHELCTDLEMVVRLEEIRLPRPGGDAERGDATADADLAYAEAFRAYGIDASTLEPSEAAQRIRTKSIRLELTVAVDHWARHLQRFPRSDDRKWKRLVAVARAADPDEWRNQVRDALTEGRTESLIALAASPKIGTLPLQSVSLLGEALKDAEASAAVLRQAQQRFPDDYWINFQLAWSLERMQPPRISEAVRFYTVAKAIRPRNLATRMFLGKALHRRGDLDDAIAEYRKAIELQPDYEVAHANLGFTLMAKGRSDEALAAFQDVIRLNPDHTQSHMHLAGIYHKLGQQEQTIFHASRVIELKGDAAKARSYRSRAYLHSGQWDKAADDLTWDLTSGPVGEAWFNVACLRLLAGDSKSYRDVCRQLSQRLDTEGTAFIAYLAGRACSLSPESPIAPARAVDWAKRSVVDGKTAWNLHVLGLAHYRAGEFDLAVERCEESLKLQDDWRGNMLNWLVLALAHRSLGHRDEASQWLAKAVQWRDKLSQDEMKIPVPPSTLHLQDWLEFQILLREALPLVKGQSS